jgi:hypothetical protein
VFGLYRRCPALTSRAAERLGDRDSNPGLLIQSQPSYR